MRNRDQPARLGVVLYDGLEPNDVGGTIGVVSMAARILPAIEGITIAHIVGPVALAGGLTVIAQHGFNTAPPCVPSCATSIRFVLPLAEPARSSLGPPACA
jgi:hypothetical protein